MKIVLIGGTGSSLIVLRKLHHYGFQSVTVFGYRPADVTNVSGWCDLELPALESGYAFRPFIKINDCSDEIKATQPNLIFAVGLSQLVSKEILESPTLGCVGFHPTALPRGRGRGAIAWLVLHCEDGAATFFRLRERADEGAILVQQGFHVDESDDATSVEAKIFHAEAKALDAWLPSLRTAGLQGKEQDHLAARYYGRRTPDDGLIDWKEPAVVVNRLIKASCHPYPGAFTYHADAVIKIWRCRVEQDSAYMGVIGRILQLAEDGSFQVQCGDGTLWIDGWTSAVPWLPKVGMKLGYYPEKEIHQLRAVCKDLSKRVAELEDELRKSCKMGGY